MSQHEISINNSAFWDELCGTHLATTLGISDASPASLKKFDDWYMDFYPYLYKHIPFASTCGKDVLEIGLGYGTVSQLLVQAGANYSGLDIAAGPVNMVNHRINQLGLTGQAIQGSILEPPMAEQSFDMIVAIGCLHHTGNLQLAIDQCWRLLRPGGQLIFMVYYAYSYRMMRLSSKSTFRYWTRELGGYRGVVGQAAAHERAAYDADTEGHEAPHTDWISKKSLKKLSAKFSKFSATIENIDQEPPFQRIPRFRLLNTPLPRLVGLDLYATCTK
jgi:SAM-dependent methyltransferase